VASGRFVENLAAFVGQIPRGAKPGDQSTKFEMANRPQRSKRTRHHGAAVGAGACRLRDQV